MGRKLWQNRRSGYITDFAAVDIRTGEYIPGPGSWIEKNWKVTKKLKKTIIINTELAIIVKTWLCEPIPQQQKLEL